MDLLLFERVTVVVVLVIVLCGFLWLAFNVQHEVNAAVQYNDLLWQQRLENCLCWNGTGDKITLDENISIEELT